MISDWECLNLARNGDENAWRILFQRYNTYLVRTTALITGSPDLAKDVAQETFIRLLKPRIRHQKGKFKSYLSIIAYRLALKEKKRHRWNNPNSDDSPLVDDTQSPLEKLIEQEQKKLIARVIHSLPERHRVVLVLRFYGNHSYEEIARITRTPLGTVKSRIFYAIKTCHQKFQDLGIKK